MKINIGIVAAGIVSAAFASAAHADFVLANWTFETNTPADLSNSATGPSVLGEGGVFAGTSTCQGVHVSAGTDWTTPAGNGSVNSYSANEWAVGDYFQFSTESTAYSGIKISWDQTGSNTGPRDFKLQYSTDGSTFTDFASYQLINGSWSSGAPVLTTSFSYDLSSIAALNNDSSIFFRFAVETTTAITGGTVAAAGTGRIDNVMITAVVPAPGAIALLGLAGLVGGRRRRR